MTEERRDARDVGVHRVADRHTFGREGRVVVVDPVARFLGIEERERERADALLRGEMDRVAAAARDPHRRMRLLHRLRDDVAGRQAHVVAGVTGERRLGEAAQGNPDALLPHRALVAGIDAERVELGCR